MQDTTRLAFRAGEHADGRPFGMGKRAYVQMMDTKGFRDWVSERNQNAGTDDDDVGAMSFICAQVVGGTPLKMISDHYRINFGLLYDFAYMTPERCERMRRAERGQAEYYAGENIQIADALDEEGRTDYSRDVKRDALMIKVRSDQMKAMNREKYGGDDARLGNSLENLASVLQRISERKRALPRAPEIVDVQPSEVRNEKIQGKEAAEEVLSAPRLDLTKYDGPADESSEDYL